MRLDDIVTHIKRGDIVTHVFGCSRCGIILDTKVKKHPMGFTFEIEHVHVMWGDGSLDIHNPNLLKVIS